MSMIVLENSAKKGKHSQFHLRFGHIMILADRYKLFGQSCFFFSLNLFSEQQHINSVDYSKINGRRRESFQLDNHLNVSKFEFTVRKPS